VVTLAWFSLSLRHATHGGSAYDLPRFVAGAGIAVWVATNAAAGIAVWVATNAAAGSDGAVWVATNAAAGSDGRESSEAQRKLDMPSGSPPTPPPGATGATAENLRRHNEMEKH